MSDRKISLCIPAYERTDLLLESFAKVLHDPRISEIIIVDDASCQATFDFISKRTSHMFKVKLYSNSENLDCYKNKRQAISYATNDWCILLDSDNVIDTAYLDKIYENKLWNDYTIYTPSFAKPHFDFRHFSGLLVTNKNVCSWIDEPMFETMLNAANFFVNKNEYLRIFDPTVDPVTSDSIYFCSNWLWEGNRIQVVEGLEYFHRVHSGSHYQNNVRRTPQGFH